MSGPALPANFLWGSATAAHQVEGNNSNSDCWALEHAQPSLFAEPSGDAVDQWNRFEKDLDLLKSIGLNAYRFSIEWARVEPELGHFSSGALDHYRSVIAACHKRDIAPVVTFHHFTQPLWMARLGGFVSDQFPGRFADYCGHAAAALDGIAIACTLNELNLPFAAQSYFAARGDTRQRRAAERALGAPLSAFFLFAGEHALTNGLAAHAAARQAVRAARPHLPVGMTLAISEETALPGAEGIRDERRERFYAPFLDAARDDEFVGIQTYSRLMSRPDGTVGPAKGAPITTMGWEDRPEALGEVCRWVADRWPTPMVITENGYAGDDDARRAAFIEAALAGLRAAIRDGADVRGYFYWSLLDNFEWMFGYGQHFGLIEVDRSSQQRRLKPSARVLRRYVPASQEELAAFGLANSMIL